MTIDTLSDDLRQLLESVPENEGRCHPDGQPVPVTAIWLVLIRRG